MNWRRRYLIAAGAILVISAGGVGIAVATGGGGGGGDDGDATVSGPAADQATAAALKITHGGTANSVERDGENGATWEVEVTKPDGNTVDVRLDQSYNLVVVEGDSEQADGSETGEPAGDADGSPQAEASEGAEANDANETGEANDANEHGEDGD